MRVGQRVAVELPLAGRTQGLSVPSSAIVRDIYGGEWVYAKTAPDVFIREDEAKRAAEAANAGQCTAYVTGIPKEVGFTAVQNLFAKVGAVRRVKLYKDSKIDKYFKLLLTFNGESKNHIVTYKMKFQEAQIR